MQIEVGTLTLDCKLKSLGTGRDGTFYARFMLASGEINVRMSPSEYLAGGEPKEGETVRWLVAPTRFEGTFAFLQKAADVLTPAAKAA